MFFILRSAFWFSLVLLVIPFNFGSSDPAQERAGPIETFGAAREAFIDVAGLCERKPEVCKVGKSAFNTVGVRAREAARIAYETLDENFGEPDTQSRTGGIAAAETVKLSEKPAVRAVRPQPAHLAQ